MRTRITGNQCSTAMRLTLILVASWTIVCSTSHAAAISPTGRAFTEAEELFRRDPRWLGADAALSIPLADGRTVWLFGDTFIAKSSAHVRSESEMVRNTGPWSSPIVVYRPPESDGPRPFVYAAKAHPELAGPHAADLVVTYATNSFDFWDLFARQGACSLYWPRFVLVPVGE